MEIIRITDEQKSCLCSELAKLMYEFKKIENVECIYFTSYTSLDAHSVPLLILTLVTSQIKDIDFELKFYELVSKCNLLYGLKYLERFGLHLYTNIDSNDKYSIFDITPEEIKSTNDLFNATILFDRTGVYTAIKRHAEEQREKKPKCIFNYDRLAEIHPPITEEVQDKCKKLS